MTTKIITFILLLLGMRSGFSQGFLNLNFNSANIPAGTTSGSTVPISEAIPDWTAYLGADQQTSVLYDDLAIGSAAIALLDSNSPAPGLIPGNNYTVVLQSGAGSSEDVSASIAQTALIPSTAQSIIFEASFPYAAGWQVTIAGQDIPVTEVSAINSSYAIYAGNVSPFAGQTDQLEFTALAGTGPSVNMYLDEISFSTSPIPEPGVLGLSALGSLLLAWRNRRIFSKA
jgi:PEP-CTERM motif